MSKREQPAPGEWQTDEHGQRYRMIGNCKEYEMMVSIGGHLVPESKVSEFHARNKAAEERRRAEERKAAAAAPKANCPFRDGMSTTCVGDKCALYAGGCTIAMISTRPPASDTKGLQCPIDRYKRPCRQDCALYVGGCKLTAIKINESEDK